MWADLQYQGVSAQAVLNGLGIVEPPVDVERIIRDLGIRLHKTTSPAPNWSGACNYGVADGVPNIWVRHTDAENRQRFTIAHELGHVLLHPDVKQGFRDTNYRGDYRETQANRFASDLLIPAHMVQADVHGGRWWIDELAHRYRVSTEAMHWRLINLGLRSQVAG